jgi:predicted nuclease with TOPRIM domain
VKKSDKIKELQKQIKEKENQLKKLSEHVDKSNICSDLYNKIVMEKAILNKELKDMKKNQIIDAVKSFIPHKKTLICDYFKK